MEVERKNQQAPQKPHEQLIARMEVAEPSNRTNSY
jgi:hypothetical protein